MATITGMTAAKINSLVAMQPIAVSVLAAAAASVTFSAIPATFNHLLLKVAHPAFALADYELVQLNNDTTVGNYFFAPRGTVAAATDPGFPPANKRSIVAPSAYNVSIVNAASTAMAKAIFAEAAAVGAFLQDKVSGGWTQTLAITSVKIITAGGQSYPAGSAFYLYGVN